MNVKQPSNQTLKFINDDSDENHEIKEECKHQTRFSLPPKKHKISGLTLNKGKNDEDVGEYYGMRMFKLDNSYLDEKERIINEFLDSEKVDWADPAEKCYAFYNMNKKKIMIQKRNLSFKEEEASLSSKEDLDIDSSPLMMRRKNKANTLTPGMGITRLNAYSMENLAEAEKNDRKFLPTKFKINANNTHASNSHI